MKKTFYIYIIIPVISFSQDVALYKANVLFEESAFIQAIPIYESIVKKTDDNFAKHRLATCYFKLNKDEQAEYWLSQLVNSSNKVDLKNVELLAYVLIRNSKYIEAAELVNNYVKKYPENKQLSHILDICNASVQINFDSSLYSVELMPFNSDGSDFSPTVFKNGLAFVSNRKTGIFVNRLSEETGEPFYDLFFVTKENEKGWSKVKKLSSNINTFANEGPVLFTQNDRMIYYTSNTDVTQKKLPAGKLGIYKAVLRSGKWSNFEALSFNNEKYSTAHPTLNEDGKVLYFASDMIGGKGGMDIYRVIFERGKWSEPQNLGSIVNTEKDEVFPYIYDDNQLYFSSNGHAGLGGLDIFHSTFQDENWTIPLNMGKPINSSKDDFGIIRLQGHESGYFSSNRKNGGLDDDIYAYTSKRPSFLNCDTMDGEFGLCVTIFEENTLDAGMMDGEIKLDYEWELGDGNKKRGNKAYHCYDKEGTYTVKLNVIDHLTNDVLFNEATYDITVKDFPQILINSPDTVRTRGSFKFEATVDSSYDCRIKTYYWNFGKEEFLEGMTQKKSFDEVGNYYILLGVHGETDSTIHGCMECIYKRITVQK